MLIGAVQSTLQAALGFSLLGRVMSPLLQHLAPPLSNQHTVSIVALLELLLFSWRR